MAIATDENGVPLGWELVTLTEREIDLLVEAADRGDGDECERIVEGAYGRLFGEYTN